MWAEKGKNRRTAVSLELSFQYRIVPWNPGVLTGMRASELLVGYLLITLKSACQIAFFLATMKDGAWVMVNDVSLEIWIVCKDPDMIAYVILPHTNTELLKLLE